MYELKKSVRASLPSSLLSFSFYFFLLLSFYLSVSKQIIDTYILKIQMLQNGYSEKKVSLLIYPLNSVSIVNSWSSILPERLFCIEFYMGILNLVKHTIEIF